MTGAERTSFGATGCFGGGEKTMANLGQAAARAVERCDKSPVPGIGWERVPHGTSVSLRGFGPSLEQAFEQAALALAASVTDAPVEPKLAVTVVCDAPDQELLLVEWLDALIYEMAVRRMLFGRFSVTIRGRRLYGAAWGETIAARHAPVRQPKSATVAELRVAREAPGKWSAGCTVDLCA